MKENIRVDRYTCDVCGCTEDVPAGSNHYPLFRVILPVKAHDEYGWYQKISTANFELCAQCLNKLSKILGEFYDLNYFTFCGGSIKEKGESGKCRINRP